MNELRGKTVAVLVGDDFEESEAIYPIYRLKEAGAEVVVAAEDGEEVTGKHGLPLEVDCGFEDLSADELDAVLIPGGYGPDHVRRSRAALQVVRACFDAGKLVASICHGPWVLASAGVVEGKQVTSFASIRDDLVHAGAEWVDEEVVVDEHLVTSRQPDDLPAFMRAVMTQLGAEAGESAEEARPERRKKAPAGRSGRRTVGAGRR